MHQLLVREESPPYEVGAPRRPRDLRPRVPPMRVLSSAPQSAGASLEKRLLEGAIALRRSEAVLVRAEAALIAYLAEGREYQKLGSPSLVVFARERLQISPRT